MPDPGLIGGALTEAATSYLKAVLDRPYEEIRLHKAQLELDELRARAKEREANAAWLERRQQPGYQPYRIVKDKLGNVWRVSVDPTDTREPVRLVDAPDVATKFGDVRIAVAKREMERIRGKPYEEFGWEDLQDPKVRELNDMINKADPTTSVQGQPPGLKYDIYRGHRGMGSPSVPVPGGPSTQPGPAAAPPERPAPTPRPQTPPSTPPQPPGLPPRTPARPAGPGPPAGVVPSPQWLEHYRARFKALPREEADAQWEAMRTAPAIQAETIVAFIEAYRDTYKQDPPGVETVSEPPAGVPTGRTPAPSTTTPPGGEPKTPTDTKGLPPRTQLPPTPRPPEPPPSPGNAPIERQMSGWDEDRALKRWEANLKYEDAERQRLAAERAETAAERQRMLDLSGKPTDDQNAMAIKLYNQKLVTRPNYLELAPPEQQLVNDWIYAPKLRKEEQGWKKLAQPHMDELDALQVTQDLVSDILPLIQAGNLGFLGRVDTMLNTARMYLPSYRNRWYAAAEETLRKQGIVGKISEGRLNAQVAADVETNDPEVRNRMRYLSGRSRLQTLASVLMYAHALAQKRLTGGTTRGIIKSDMEAAEKLFDPDQLFTNPEALMANLQELQSVIQRARGNVQAKVQSFYFDPTTKQYIPPTGPNPAPDDEEILGKVK